MTEWKECTISDIGTVIGGATPSTKNPKNYDNGTIPWITPKDLSTLNYRYIESGARNITQWGLNSCSATLLPPNTVLFSSRAPIGYIAIAKKHLCTNQGFKNIIPNKNIDSLFLYYLLKNNKDRIENMGSGTTFKEVSGNVMKKIRIRIPTAIKEQKKIAKILGVMDDIIENSMMINHNLWLYIILYVCDKDAGTILFIYVFIDYEEINHNLEEQAKAIYKKMFMDNTPKNSPQSRLEDIAEITMGQSPHGSSFNEKEQGRIFFQGRAEFGQRFPKVRLYTTEPSRIAKANDILISVRAPVGDINIAHKDCCIGRGLASIRARNGCQSFMLYTMLSLKRKLDIFNAEGTVFGAINKQALNTLPVFVPIEEKIRTFERIVAPTDEIILNNYTEICKLEKIRDALLPKLMSGEIDVSAVEIGR
ncbi:restriction endonuclease subunit S [Treponema sp. HNW]|uniref:restriction endonuclease subunit S n=1 Tax=Treponema sp. HNW TaxID=3116654 RepID=UPI003D096F0F